MWCAPLLCLTVLLQVGVGNGANIASAFAARHGYLYESSLRAIVVINGFASVDPLLAGVLHSCINVFKYVWPYASGLCV